MVRTMYDRLVKYGEVHMERTFAVRPATGADIPLLQHLAHTIWYAHYPGIITVEQIEYMLADGYSTEKIRHEMETEGISWLLVQLDGEAVGFAAFGDYVDGCAKLHKLYLAPDQHGRGWGSRVLEEVERLATESGYRQIVLNVNKHNTKAIHCYQRCGYQVLESVVNDIGGGFVMDDYIMGKQLVHGRW